MPSGQPHPEDGPGHLANVDVHPPGVLPGAGWGAVAVEFLGAVGAAGGGGAVRVEGQSPAPPVHRDQMVERALCRAAGYAALGGWAGGCACLRMCVVVVKSA